MNSGGGLLPGGLLNAGLDGLWKGRHLFQSEGMSYNRATEPGTVGKQNDNLQWSL